MGFKENVEKPEEKVGTGSTSVGEPPKAALKRKKWTKQKNQENVYSLEYRFLNFGLSVGI